MDEILFQARVRAFELALQFRSDDEQDGLTINDIVNDASAIEKYICGREDR